MRLPPPDQARPTTLRRPRARRIWLLVIAVVLVVLLLSLQGAANFYTNYLWYRSEHLSFVWRSIVVTKLGLAAVFVATSFVILWTSLWFVDRLAPRALLFAPDLELVRRYQAAVGPHVKLVRTIVAAVIALLVGEGAAGQWQNWILFQHAVSFGVNDPLFGRDASFFVFRLPFLSFLVQWLVVMLIVVLVVTAISHYLNGSIRLQGAGPRVDPIAIAHLSLILGVLALVKAVGYYYVQRFELEFSTRGVVQGASYTDVHVRLPALTLLAVVALAAFVVLGYNVYQRSLVLPLIGVGLWLLVALAVGVIYPAVVQAFKVTPSQSTLELPYIADNISATRLAYGLSHITEKSFPASSTATAASLADYAVTLRDGVLWDPAPTNVTFHKLQDARSYFQLNGLAVDRYSLNGVTTPVVVGVRTLDSGGIPSPSWVNTHLQYTHGYGAILTPANTSAQNGNPSFLISNLPPTVSAGAKGVPAPTEEQVYFGVQANNYVVVDSAQKEIDYTDQNGSNVQESQYQGSGGVPIGSFWTRAAFALRFHDLNLLISKLVTSQSKIIFVQGVREMVEKAAPFLQVDSNPYPVLSNGRIFWIVDAYTTTSFFPYSQAADTSALPDGSGLQGTYNYIRNSVKVTVDAYTGQMSFYVVNQADPLIEAYEAAFPGLLQPFADMPADLQSHLRYPQDFLTVQSTMYGRYHLDAEEVTQFYNQANAWELAQSPGTGSPSSPLPLGSNGTIVRFTPIYELLELGGPNTPPAFDALEPFVPFSQGDKLQTLTGFMVAACDYSDYGALTIYTTPQGVDGPALVDAEINANAAVSRQISLLDQHGSVVTAGSVLALPVGGALVYVRPIYLSSAQNQFPQLRLVIAVYGNQVGMETTLSAALGDVFKVQVPGTGVGQFGQGLGAQAAQVTALIDKAQQDSALAQAALAAKPPDLGLYETYNSEASSLLSQIEKLLAKAAKAGTTPATGTKTASADGSGNAGGTGAGNSTGTPDSPTSSTVFSSISGGGAGSTTTTTMPAGSASRPARQPAVSSAGRALSAAGRAGAAHGGAGGGAGDAPGHAGAVYGVGAAYAPAAYSRSKSPLRKVTYSDPSRTRARFRMPRSAGTANTQCGSMQRIRRGRAFQVLSSNTTTPPRVTATPRVGETNLRSRIIGSRPGITIRWSKTARRTINPATRPTSAIAGPVMRALAFPTAYSSTSSPGASREAAATVPLRRVAAEVTVEMVSAGSPGCAGAPAGVPRAGRTPGGGC